MKNVFKTCCVLLLTLNLSSSVLAEEQQDDCENSEWECYEEYATELDETEANFFSKSFISNDEEIRELELEEFYVKYFFETATVPYQAVDTFGVDVVENSILTIIIAAATLLEFVGLMFTLLIMIVTNLVENNFFVNIVIEGVNSLLDIVFDFDNPTGTFAIIVIFITLISIIREIFKIISNSLHHFNKDFFIKSFRKMIIAIFIVIGYTSILPIYNDISNSLEEFIMTTIFQSEEEIENETPYEITAKREIFNAMQFYPYMQKNFCVATIDELAEKDQMNIEETNNRVTGVLVLDAGAIGREVDDYNNECITQSVATGFLSLAFSLIFFIHKLLFFVLIFILKIMLLIINLLAELVIVFLFIPLILLIYDNSSKISTVIIKRIEWVLALIVVEVIFTFIITILSSIVFKLLSINMFLLLTFDITLILIGVLIYSNREVIAEFASKMIANNALKGILTGNYSVKEGYSDVKSATLKIQENISKVFSQKTEIIDEDEKTNDNESTSNIESFDENLMVKTEHNQRDNHDKEDMKAENTNDDLNIVQEEVDDVEDNIKIENDNFSAENNLDINEDLVLNDEETHTGDSDEDDNL